MGSVLQTNAIVTRSIRCGHRRHFRKVQVHGPLWIADRHWQAIVRRAAATERFDKNYPCKDGIVETRWKTNLTFKRTNGVETHTTILQKNDRSA